MRWQALLVVVTLSLAGCASRNAEPVDADGTPVVSSSVRPTETLLPEAPTKTGGFTWLEIDAANLSYSSSLERFILRAGPGGANISLGIDGRIPSYTADDDCLAVAVHPEFARPTGGNATNGSDDDGLMGVFWSWKNNAGYSRVRAAGQEHEVDLFDTLGGEADGSGDIVVSGEFFASLKEGEAIRIDLGGRNGRMLHGANQLTPSHFVVNITAIGEILLGVDEPAPLACGTALFQAQGSDLSITNGVGSVVAGGRIDFDSATASTLLFRTGSDDTVRDARLVFLDETVAVGTEPLDVVRTSNQPGRMAFEIETWANGFPSDPNWFFADVFWPVLTSG